MGGSSAVCILLTLKSISTRPDAQFDESFHLHLHATPPHLPTETHTNVIPDSLSVRPTDQEASLCSCPWLHCLPPELSITEMDRDPEVAYTVC